MDPKQGKRRHFTLLSSLDVATSSFGDGFIKSSAFPWSKPSKGRGRLAHFVALSVSAFALALSLSADAKLFRHERLSENPTEDLAYGVTTSSGTMPLVMETSSGLVTAPSDSPRPVGPSGVYGGDRTARSSEAIVGLDPYTEAPLSVDYHEPFRPAVTPFKRLYALDTLREDFTLTVASQELTKMAAVGNPGAADDLFYGDLRVQLVAGVAVRIPSVGPSSRILSYDVEPKLRLQFLRDGAENWFVLADRSESVHLTLQLAMPRRRFLPANLQISIDALGRHASPLPERALVVAREVIDALGLSTVTKPGTALERLVGYYRGFRESNEKPKAQNPLDLYRELTLERRGVCRHRAFSFFVTARALGFDVRFIHNEAHAWVEVFDGTMFQRIDLGGAATSINDEYSAPNVVNFSAPPDPFLWPSSATQGGRASPSEASRASGWPSAQSGDGVSHRKLSGPTAAEMTKMLARSASFDVSLVPGNSETARGGVLPVSGVARRAGKPCQSARIDIVYIGGETRVTLGSLPTNSKGEFSGQVTLPTNLPLGKLKLEARVHDGCD